MSRAWLPYFLLTCAAMLCCGLFAIHLGKDISWDVANYHYYNPYAFLHHRWQQDCWPAEYCQIYFTPTLDFFTYFLINYFRPSLTVFITGALQGLNLLLIFAIATLFFPRSDRFFRWLVLLITLVSLFSPVAFYLLGSFQGDNFTSIFLLCAFLLQIHAIQQYVITQRFSVKWLLISGISLGIGAGLKLPAGMVSLGYFIACLCLPFNWSTRIKWLFYSGIGVAIGFAGSTSYWMLILWQQFHSPFYPLFNKFFHAPGFPPININDPRLVPKSFLEFLLYPFYFQIFPPKGIHFSRKFMDFRYLFLYLFYIYYGVYSACQRFIKHKKPKLQFAASNWLLICFVISFFTWIGYFPGFRYFVPLELLTPIILVLLIMRIFSERFFYTYISIVTLTIILVLTPFLNHERAEIKQDTDFFNVQIPTTITHMPQALVLMGISSLALSLSPYPQSYLIPFFPPQWRFVGVPFHFQQYVLSEKIKGVVAAYQGPIYLLTSAETMPSLYKAAAELGLKPTGNCFQIDSARERVDRLAPHHALLCPVT